MGRSTSQETVLSDKRKYRKFTPKQKVELVLASFGGDRSVQAEQRRRIAELERALGKKTYELELGFR